MIIFNVFDRIRYYHPRRHEISLRCLNQISTRDISKTSQKHLKRDVLFTMSLRRLKYISEKMFSCYVFKASQTYLKKDVCSVTYLICLKNIYLEIFRNKTNSEARRKEKGYSEIPHKNSFVLIKLLCSR